MASDIRSILLDTFGLQDFREGQEDIIKSVVSGHDTLVFMPTGGGKSLTYQIPGIALPGITIVISPLISLMKDQIDKLRERGIASVCINSTISSQEQRDILEEIRYPGKFPIKFVYIAPERLHSEEFLSVISKVKVSLIAIDEAHCVSQWGHDFRPSYMKIKDFIKNLRNRECPDEEENTPIPVIALTATATKKVRTDIMERLGLDRVQEFIYGFDRKNIVMLVREIPKKEEKLEKVAEIIEKTPGSGIVYAASIKNVEEVYNHLKSKGVSVGKYTGSMDSMSRELSQNDFMDSSTRVVVATNAFGMGIDKKDIRFVIHYNLPGSVEGYYQEIGRAGRDGRMSIAVILASFADTKIQEFFVENSNPDQEEILDFYDYLYEGLKDGEGKGKTIEKTYAAMGHESGIGNDMKVGSILKILEKYKIVGRGIDGEKETNAGFRGKGITLLKEKRAHQYIPIDWAHQNMLKKEADMKLAAMKKLLFTPQCRKRFILNYFSDLTDLEKLPRNCGMCDYCIDQKKGIVRKRPAFTGTEKRERKIRERKQVGRSQKTDTYEETLRLFREQKNLSAIADERGVTTQTIEAHIAKLYGRGTITIEEVSKLTMLENIEYAREIIEKKFSGKAEKLREIKDVIEREGRKDIRYFDIHLAIARIEKGE
ncbi:MAG: RecQ family ATP-dependent DNA helicase [Candidatus Gracilibacteria bacterium]|nr:RecQ family ATP-dependent DNA helicase [Candidatus Gracilibacteria bacterium]